LSERIRVADLLASLAREWPAVAARVHLAVPYLYRARDQLFDDVCERLAPYGLRPADVDVLAALRTRPPPRQLTPTVLYRSLLLSSGGLTKILTRLEREGLVERLANPADGRSHLVRLTERGAARLDEVVPVILAQEADFLAPLEAAERQELGRLLAKLVERRG
jgi:DNA-binding MarR family transcriptional regulator